MIAVCLVARNQYRAECDFAAGSGIETDVGASGRKRIAKFNGFKNL